MALGLFSFAVVTPPPSGSKALGEVVLIKSHPIALASNQVRIFFLHVKFSFNTAGLPLPDPARPLQHISSFHFNDFSCAGGPPMSIFRF